MSVELCAWPKEKANRKYAGVSHLDVDNTSDAYLNHIKSYAKSKDVEIVAIGYYPNPLDPNKENAKKYIDHIKKVVFFSHKLGINKVSTFIGKDKNKTVDENFKLFMDVWPDIIAYAESLKVYVGIENCPMYFTTDEWPGGNNLASSPVIWEKMFELIPSKYFGLSYDPSHLNFQFMDYIKPLYDFKDRLVHIHLKDTLVDMDKLNQVGIFTPPLDYMDPKIPGRGSIDWSKFLNALKDINYNQGIVIEIEDRAFEDSFESVIKSIELSIGHISSL
jgi:sugar phosphate isomerase/epimerase